MKKVMLVACLMTVSAVVHASPALRQFKMQADCVTSTALELLGGEAPSQNVLQKAANACVPASFSPEMEGVPAHMRPSTRDERIASVSKAAAYRIKICEKLGITGADRSAECVKVFQKDGQP